MHRRRDVHAECQDFFCGAATFGSARRIEDYGPSRRSQFSACRKSPVLNIGMLGAYGPTPCGTSAFSSALAGGLDACGVTVNVVRVADAVPSGSARVVGELVVDSAASAAACAGLLNSNDVVIVHHDEGRHGGPDAAQLLDIVEALEVPTILVVHEHAKSATSQQRSDLERLAAPAAQVVVLSESAHTRFCADVRVDRRKVLTIPHGATLPPRGPIAKRNRPTMLTWGELRPGKGVERVIDVMGDLRQLNGRPRYVVAGQTPLAADAQAYRDACVERVRSRGLTDAVYFESGCRTVAGLSALVRSAAVAVLPYDSTDQAASAVLADAIANGRPVVATAFPHAVELLSTGAGIVVDHDDPDALTAALRSVLTQPRLAGEMAAEARRLAPAMAWSVVANSYRAAAYSLLSRCEKSA